MLYHSQKGVSNQVWVVHCFGEFTNSKTQVAYGGVYPSVDPDGRSLIGIRASKAGSKLPGGPYALTSIRRVFKHVWFQIRIKHKEFHPLDIIIPLTGVIGNGIVNPGI